MKYFILLGKQFSNTSTKKIYLNTTQLNLERYDLISINFDTFVHANRLVFLQKLYSGEFCLSPANIYTMDQLVSTMFYKIKPMLRIKQETNFKINKNFQKIINQNQVIINSAVDAVLKSNNFSGYAPKRFKPPIAKLNMQLKFA